MQVFKKAVIAAAVGGALAAGATGARAAAQMSIWDGVAATPVVVADGGAGDSNLAAGVITWIGSIGVWSINVDTGLTRPVLGSTTLPHMDLNFIDYSSGAGTLTLMFTDTDYFGSGVPALVAALGGTTSGAVTYEVWADSTNTPFGLQQQVTTLAYGAPVGSGTASGTFTVNGLYSLTQVIRITHRGAGVTSGDAEAQVPVPASLALLGAGLAGLGWARRRRS